MFIHPETEQQFVRAKAAIHQAQPKMRMSNVEEAARSKIWIENLMESDALLKELCMCPGMTHPVEEYERAVRMEEVLDDQYPESWDEEEI